MTSSEITPKILNARLKSALYQLTLIQVTMTSLSPPYGKRRRDAKKEFKRLINSLKRIDYTRATEGFRLNCTNRDIVNLIEYFEQRGKNLFSKPLPMFNPPHKPPF